MSRGFTFHASSSAIWRRLLRCVWLVIPSPSNTAPVHRRGGVHIADGIPGRGAQGAHHPGQSVVETVNEICELVDSAVCGRCRRDRGDQSGRGQSFSRSRSSKQLAPAVRATANEDSTAPGLWVTVKGPIRRVRCQGCR